ncbi:Imidazolonepropionase [Gillisia sp. Hel1_33_143]|uniref:amidohydrolase family protein n=1 Tax=Gillisia sp. Hel1_33_143 TaxID=1336796 RepID=UPI00087D57CB|nr:amidohydrolase family protein [Gillisia sp. Hel1_33_143]SDS42940.1 Imidazolonepropionase [Gillisia sp. Hel1_33_143]
MKLKILLFSLVIMGSCAQAQEYFPKNDGVKSENNNYTVFENAKIHVDANTIIENGMFAVRNGKITAVGKKINIPKNAIKINLDGNDVYPSFIDIYSDYGIAKPKKAEGGGQPQYDASREGYYWNDHIRPETNAVEYFSYDKEAAEKLQKNGFGVVNTHMADGIIRGAGMLVALNPEGTTGDRILSDRSAEYLSFNKSVQSRQSYPTSIMGAMALLRQTYLDAAWYTQGKSKNKDLALEALNRNKALTKIFKTDNLLDELRADKIGDEFGFQYIIYGNGNEFERLEEIKKTNATYIVPLNFPDAYDVENPFMANYVSLQDMKRWNQAPSNLAMMQKNGIPFVITTNDLKDEKKFKENLLKAIEYGLDKRTALNALTTIPAKLIGQENKLGVLKEGAWANFLITSGDYFDKETVLYENWVQGNRTAFTPMDTPSLAGNYTLKLDGNTYDLKFSGEPNEPKVDVKVGETKVKSKLTYSDSWMNLMLESPDSTKSEYIRLVARVNSKSDNLQGSATLNNGTETSFYAMRSDDVSEEKKEKEKEKDVLQDVMPVSYPNMAYGFETLPTSENILFKNATVWTNTSKGIMENTDVLIKDGKIAAVGKDLNAGKAKVVDATGKHLTSGIIDEHSHIAASAINEAGQNSTAEVTMEDVVDPSDINIYRNLAGGVTTVQLLHGSANPIGGRSAILKLKWGAAPNEMIFKEAPKFIKFALGENVKQANWGSTTRFPQTRMGTEQVYMDYFSRARNYEAAKKEDKNFRKDLEMETLVEILNGNRFVSSHSYIQSEINMLMTVAEKFDFRINTFTHILEGYKVADKMKEHGVGASTFSDWWAYKYEVKDAIPYNAAILHDAGVTVAINSDDPEMSRRLNQEAAKSVKYGGVSEEEAWKFVTLNPAKLLHIDNLVGSVESGKNADVVLWSGNPLSIYSKAEKTLIDGTVYFDLERDEKLRQEITKEKSILTTQMLAAKNGGSKTKPVVKKENQTMGCDTIEIH